MGAGAHRPLSTFTDVNSGAGPAGRLIRLYPPIQRQPSGLGGAGRRAGLRFVGCRPRPGVE